MLAAVGTDGKALRYASEELRENYYLVNISMIRHNKERNKAIEEYLKERNETIEDYTKKTESSKSRPREIETQEEEITL